MSSTKVSIPGIHCEGCSRLIQDVSNDLPGVSAVSVDLESKQVTIDHDDGFDFQLWKKEIESLNEEYNVQLLS